MSPVDGNIYQKIVGVSVGSGRDQTGGSRGRGLGSRKIDNEIAPSAALSNTSVVVKISRTLGTLVS